MDVLTTVFLKVVEMGLSASLVILIVLPIRLMMKRLSAGFAYLLWIAVAVRLITPETIASPVSIFNLDLQAADSYQKESNIKSFQGVAEMVSYDDGVSVSTWNQNFADGETQGNTDADWISTSSNNEETAAKKMKWTNILALVWIAGIMILVLFMAAAHIRIGRSVRYGTLLCDAQPHAGDVCRLSGKKKLAYSVNVYECDNIRSPFVFGLLPPRIYSPYRLNERERQCVLMHERIHIAKGDYFIKNTAYLLAVIYWFHPLIWIAFHLMCADMEMRCDESVLSKMDVDMKKEYGNVLLAFAANRRQISAGFLAFGEENVMKRVKHILSYKKPSRWKTAAGTLGLMLTIVACGTDADGNKTTSLSEANLDIAESEPADLKGQGTETDATEEAENGMPHRAAQWAANTMMDHELCTLDYADENTIIFHISSGLFQYDLQQQGISRSLDLQALDCQKVQTGGECRIQIYKNKENRIRAVIESYPYKNTDIYIYDFDTDRLVSYDAALLENDTLYDVEHGEGYVRFDGLDSKWDMENNQELKNWRYSENVLPMEDGKFGILYFDTIKLSTLKYLAGGREYTLFRSEQATLPELLKQDDSFYQSFVLNATENETQCILEYTGFYNSHDYAGMCALSTGLDYSDELQKEWGTHKDFIGAGNVLMEKTDEDYVIVECFYYADKTDYDSDEKIYISARYIEGQGWRVDGLPSFTLP